MNWAAMSKFRGGLDGRYRIAKEFCGYATARWVVRFCDEWVGQKKLRRDAVTVAAEHSAARRK